MVAFGESDYRTASLLGHLARACLAQKIPAKTEFAVSLLERQVYPCHNMPVSHVSVCVNHVFATLQLHMLENDASLQRLLPERLSALQDLSDAYREADRQSDADTVI